MRITRIQSYISNKRKQSQTLTDYHLNLVTQVLRCIHDHIQITNLFNSFKPICPRECKVSNICKSHD